MTSAKRPARRRLRRWTIAACLALLVVCLHAPMLRMLGGCLVADESQTAGDALLIVGGDRCFDAAARRYAHGEAESILLYESQLGRLVLLKIVPADQETARRELALRGVPLGAIALLQNRPAIPGDPAARLATWLAEHPEKRVVVLSDRFRSALLSWDYDRAIARPQRNRVAIWALADRRYDETNWWHSKVGIKAFFRAIFDQIYIRVRGVEPEKIIDFDPDAYERLVF